LNNSYNLNKHNFLIISNPKGGRKLGNESIL